MTDILNDSMNGMPDVVEKADAAEAKAVGARAAELASQRAVAHSLSTPTGGGQKRWSRRYVVLLVWADTVASLVAALGAYIARRWATSAGFAHGYLRHATYAKLAALSLVAWLGVLALSGAYRSKHVASDERDYRVPVRSAVQLVAGVAITSYAFHLMLPRAMLLGYGIVLVLAVLVCRGIVNMALRNARAKGRARARVLIIGEERTIRNLAEYLLTRPNNRCDIVGACSPSTSDSIALRHQSVGVFGTPDRVLDAVTDLEADTVVIASLSGLGATSLQQVSWQLERSGIDLFVAPDTVSLSGPRLKISSLQGLPVMHVRHPDHEGLIRRLHFALCRFAGALLLALAAPVFLLIAVAIKVRSPGPVFYRQRRVGYQGQEFDMLKFRSMVTNADDLLPALVHLNEHDGALFKIRNDPRITRVGRFLRKYSLDELPQLINVVRGEMSLVGPRPCLAREMIMFGDAEHRRFMVRPGMTGLWQVSGGPSLPWSDAVRTDLYYVDNWSIGLDISILFRTIRVVLGGNGY